MTKVCTKCRKRQLRTEFHKHFKARDGLQTRCKSCHNDHNKIYYNNHKAQTRNYNFKTTYGLSYQHIVLMLRQQAKLCPICGSRMHLGRKNDTRAVIDHNHKTGRVRGLICSGCNQMLGNAKDNVWTLHKAIEYLNAIPKLG